MRARGRRTSPADGVLQPTSLRVNRGEIVGVAGLVGSGKAELGWRSAAPSPAKARSGSPAARSRWATRARRSPAASASSPTTASARRCCRTAAWRRTSRSRGSGGSRGGLMNPRGERSCVREAIRATGSSPPQRRASSPPSPAATSRRWSSAAPSSATSRSSSSPSRPAASTSAPSAKSTDSAGDRGEGRRHRPHLLRAARAARHRRPHRRLLRRRDPRRIQGPRHAEEEIAHVAVTGAPMVPDPDQQGDVMTDQPSAAGARGRPGGRPEAESRARVASGSRSGATPASSWRCSSSRST